MGSPESMEPLMWWSFVISSMRPTMSVVETPSVRLNILNLPMDFVYAYTSFPSGCSRRTYIVETKDVRSCC